MLTHSSRAQGAPADTETHFQCQVCKAVEPIRHNGGTGYGVDPATREVHCYACCAKREAARMTETGRATLYLCRNADGTWRVTDWTGGLSIVPVHLSRMRHPFARSAYLARFCTPDGAQWSGKNIGDSQILHCRRLRASA